jgi:tRNA-splicing endonuclease subunit Sen54
VLAAARDAMHTALSGTRVHSEKSHLRATWFPSLGLARVRNARGNHFRAMGRTDKAGSTWLRPEETLYLLERGNLDGWVLLDEDLKGRVAFGAALEEELELLIEDRSTPMSLQSAYAWCLSAGDGVCLERYQVYAQLRRIGYVVIRAPSWDDEEEVIRRTEVRVDSAAEKPKVVQTGFMGRMFELLSRNPSPNFAQGPLVGPGLYRSYSKCYLQQNFSDSLLIHTKMRSTNASH